LERETEYYYSFCKHQWLSVELGYRHKHGQCFKDKGHFLF